MTAARGARPRPQRRSLSAAIDIVTQQLESAMVAGDDVRVIRLCRVLCRLEERIPEAGSGPVFDVEMPR